MTCWAKGPRCASTKLVLCPVDSPLWQRVVDDLCQTRAATQRIPPPLPSAPAAHQVAGQSHQHQGPGARSFSDAFDGLGYAHRMQPNRLPREILYGELRESIQHVGRPLMRYNDVIKQDLRSALIDTSAWEDKHRDTWRKSVKAGYMQESGQERMRSLCVRFHKARLCHLQQRLPLQDWATQSYKILPKSLVLTIDSLKRGCHYIAEVIRRAVNETIWSQAERSTATNDWHATNPKKK